MTTLEPEAYFEQAATRGCEMLETCCTTAERLFAATRAEITFQEQGAPCETEPWGCGGLARCATGPTTESFCQPRLCDGDPDDDARTILTWAARLLGNGGPPVYAECTLPPDGYFVCTCTSEGVQWSCRKDRPYRVDDELPEIDCCHDPR